MDVFLKKIYIPSSPYYNKTPLTQLRGKKPIFFLL